MNSWLKYGILFCAAFNFFPLSASTGGVGLTFDEWVEEFRREAVENGVSAQSLDTAFRSLQLEPSVIVKDRKQPEFRRDFQTYLDNAVNDQRIKKAKRFMKEYAVLLAEIEQKYKVPANYLLAFWGMETNFGASKGSYPTLNVLATLAYDTRRPDFFRAELMHGVRLVQDGLSVDQMFGSWAGAVGNFQFMPSTFRRYGTDHDGDGAIDLWNSLPDALASAANYLSSAGWKPDVGWGREVSLPKKFDWSLIEQEKTVREWLELGISFTNKTYMNDTPETVAKLFLPAGIHGPAFLAYANFDVILEWNRSVLYAISVGHLADRISGNPAFSRKYVQRGASFTLENAQEVQELLAKMELYDGEIDGVLGRKSREAIRRFQTMYGLPADGYANASLLHFMRLALSGGAKRDSLTFDEIAELQKILSKGSYYIGPVDGKLGASTLKGIELYKTVYGIASETVDRTLLEEMRVQFARNLENGEVEPLVQEHLRQEKERKKAQEALKKAKKRKNGKTVAGKKRKKNTPQENIKKKLTSNQKNTSIFLDSGLSTRYSAL